MLGISASLRSLTITAILVLAAACGGSKNNGQYQLNGVGYDVVSAGTLAHGGTSVSGTGSIVFVTPLSGDKNNYKLAFTLQDGGSIELVAHANGSLQSGASVRIERSGASLKAGKEGTTLATLAGVNAAAAVSLFVDVHNGEGSATTSHLAIWNGDATSFTETSALLNVEPDNASAVAKGTGGSAWGLKLTNATITSVTLGAAKNPDI